MRKNEIEVGDYVRTKEKGIFKIRYKLCYVDGNKAWFTDNFEKQHGDDWDDKPYECNAGEPYVSWNEIIEDNPNVFERKWKEHKINIKTLYFETNNWTEQQPKDAGRFSVEEINKQKVPWLKTDKYSIYAGISYEEFINTIEDTGGNIYVENIVEI